MYVYEKPERSRTVKLSDWLVCEGQSVYVDDNEEAGDTYTLRDGKFYDLRVEYGMFRYEYPEQEVPGSTEITVYLPSFEAFSYFKPGDNAYSIYASNGKWLVGDTLHKISRVEIILEARAKYARVYFENVAETPLFGNVFKSKEDALLECIRRERAEGHDRDHGEGRSEI